MIYNSGLQEHEFVTVILISYGDFIMIVSLISYGDFIMIVSLISYGDFIMIVSLNTIFH